MSKRKYKTRFFNIFVANEVKRIFVKEHYHRMKKNGKYIIFIQQNLHINEKIFTFAAKLY